MERMAAGLTRNSAPTLASRPACFPCSNTRWPDGLLGRLAQLEPPNGLIELVGLHNYLQSQMGSRSAP